MRKTAPDADPLKMRRNLPKSAREHFQRALKHYERALKTLANDPRIYLALGFTHEYLGHHDKAMTIWHQGLKKTVENAEISVALAETHIDHKEFEQAQKVIDELKTTLVEADAKIRHNTADLRRSLDGGPASPSWRSKEMMFGRQSRY